MNARLGRCMIALILCSLAAGPWRGLSAQTASQRLLCLTPRPILSCKSLLFIEAGLVQPLTGSSRAVAYQTPSGLDEEYYRADPFGLSLETTVGVLFNVHPRLAAGGGARLGMGTGDDGPEWSALARLRFWLDERYTVDIQAGGAKRSPGGQFQGPYLWGPTLSARLAHARWGFVGARFDAIDVPPGDFATDVQGEYIIRDPGGSHSAVLLEAGVSGLLAVATSVLWLMLSQLEFSY